VMMVALLCLLGRGLSLRGRRRDARRRRCSACSLGRDLMMERKGVYVSLLLVSHMASFRCRMSRVGEYGVSAR
jgi:hypothetical protein